jgi:hypothetical protein
MAKRIVLPAVAETCAPLTVTGHAPVFAGTEDPFLQMSVPLQLFE